MTRIPAVTPFGELTSPPLTPDIPVGRFFLPAV